ncbi:hypothetical protein [Streptomyces sp. NPDC048636]|uniref:hypothetical protein n=1 Tax=Streptomyces sp. NPDC048636 TaxID=3155762 RepID=UPI0034282BB7
MRADLDRQDRARSAIPPNIPPNGWFVRLRFRASGGAMAEHYYFVDEAIDAHDAAAIALRKAAAAHECSARGNAKIDDVEVRRLRWNPLGWAYLGAPLVRTGTAV